MYGILPPSPLGLVINFLPPRITALNTLLLIWRMTGGRTPAALVGDGSLCLHTLGVQQVSAEGVNEEEVAGLSDPLGPGSHRPGAVES